MFLLMDSKLVTIRIQPCIQDDDSICFMFETKLHFQAYRGLHGVEVFDT